MAEYLSKLDDLINNLESAMEETEEIDFKLAAGEPPKRATFRILSETYTSRLDRQPRPAEMHEMMDGHMLLRSRSDVARGMRIEVHVLMSKSGEGETLLRMAASVDLTRRVSGAYEVQATASSFEKVVVPAPRRFLECAAAHDAAAWNRWCADLEEGPVLKGLDLGGMVLANFDLACADLSGSNLDHADLSGTNLSGADLSGCSMNGVRVSGADFFRARLPRKYMGLILASGTIEAESVILSD